MRFIVFLVRFVGKRTKNRILWAMSRSFIVAKRPLAAAKVLVAAKDPHTAARPRRRIFHPRVCRNKAELRSLRSHCSQHEKCCVLFCSAIPLFQGLFHWTNEDPISV